MAPRSCAICWKPVETIRTSLTQDAIIILKSTVPVGTADKVKNLLKGVTTKVDVVSNPEFLKEGTAIDDFLRPERVIIGTESETARRVMADLYSPFIRSGNPILFMNNRSAELSKYAANAFLAMKISFINDLALLAEKVDAEIHDVRRALVPTRASGTSSSTRGVGTVAPVFQKTYWRWSRSARKSPSRSISSSPFTP